MSFKLVVSDIDGTFLNSEKKISPATLDVCRRLHFEKGVRFALASGRGRAGIRPVADALGFPVFILACNGAEVFDENGVSVYRRTLSLAETLALKSAVRDFSPDVETIVYAGDDWIADAMTDTVRGECYVMPVAPLIGDPAAVIPENTPILKMIGVGTVENTTALMAKMAPMFPQCDFYKSQHYIMEAVAKGVNKASGLDVLCAHCGIDVAETIAFGDSYNDTEMLCRAGLGVAMGNAAPDVRKYAKRVAATNDDDGIAETLNEIFY